MSRVGELLKQEREKRGLSLHEIGMSLKINAKILKAIEEGDTKTLPARTFLRGFIRSYAQYLRLDVNQVMEVFHQEFGGGSENSNAAEANSTATQQTAQTKAPLVKTAQKVQSDKLVARREEQSLEKLNSSNKISTIIGALVLVGLIGFVVKMIEKYQKESEISATAATLQHLEPVTPDVVTSANDGLDGSAGLTTESTTTLAGQLLETTTTQAGTSTTHAVTTTIAAIAPVSTIKTTTTLAPTTTLKITTTTLKSTTTTTLAKTTTTTTPVASTTPTTVANGKPVEVILEASGSASVRYSISPDKWQTLQMSAGDVQTLRSKTQILVEVSDGGALSWIMNGRTKGKMGSAGQAAKVKAP